jgi:hypothetical protein
MDLLSNIRQKQPSMSTAARAVQSYDGDWTSTRRIGAYSVATRQTESTTPFGLPTRRKRKSLYSPEGKKKMGFGK